MNTIRYFLDTEFIDDGHTIDLISIALVAEDGREYSAQSMEFDASKASPWVQENVLPQLAECDGASRRIHALQAESGLRCMGRKLACGCPWRTRGEIAQELASFCDPLKYHTPEFIGWCAGYDWVVLCQLYGTMMSIPRGWPHYISDLQQILDAHGILDDQLPTQESGIHNALADARHIKTLWEFLKTKE